MLLHYTPDTRNPLMWHKDTKTFTIEASDLPDADVTPIGSYAHKAITIRVPASGNAKVFFEKRVVRDADNDVMFWEYEAEGGFHLHVFND
jgi:hypothetical protein